MGGDVAFFRNVVGTDYYYPLAEEWTLHVGGEVGNITGIGEDTRIIDRFFIGSQQIRGFAPAGIGPRDQATDDALGAKNYYATTAEVRFPLGLPDEYPVRGRVFADVGSAWSVDNAPGVVLDETSPRVSIGAGLSWRSPLGPLEVDVGFPIVKEDFDEKELLRFSFGTRF